MSRDPYDPRKIGVAAGSTEDPFNLGLSDKGAKDFKQGMTAMEKTSRMGGFKGFQGMLMKLLESSPAVEIFSAFLEMFGAQFWGQINWALLIGYLEKLAPLISAVAEGIGEELNKELEETCYYLDRLGEYTNAANEYFASLEKNNEAWKVFADILRQVAYYLSEFTRGLSVIPKMNTDLRDFNLELSNFQTLINNFRFPSYGGNGGDGGGGDGNEWWEEFFP